MRVFIKGNEFQAARAAADRGIPFAFRSFADGLTVGAVGDQYWEEVAAWFREDGAPPFHPGACLSYGNDAPGGSILAELLEACETALNLETAAIRGAELPACEGLDVSYHFDKIRRAIRRARGEE